MGSLLLISRTVYSLLVTNCLDDKTHKSQPAIPSRDRYLPTEVDWTPRRCSVPALIAHVLKSTVGTQLGWLQFL